MSSTPSLPSAPPLLPQKPQKLRSPSLDTRPSLVASGSYVSVSPTGPVLVPSQGFDNGLLPHESSNPVSNFDRKGAGINSPIPIPPPIPPSYNSNLPYDPTQPYHAGDTNLGQPLSLGQEPTPPAPNSQPIFRPPPISSPVSYDYQPSPQPYVPYAATPTASLSPGAEYYNSGHFQVDPSTTLSSPPIPQNPQSYTYHHMQYHPYPVTTSVSTSVPHYPLSFPNDGVDVVVSDSLFREAERHREKAAMAQKEKLESERVVKQEGKFTNRVSAAGTFVVKWIEEKHHENKAKQYERQELSRHLKAAQAQRKKDRLSSSHGSSPSISPVPPRT